MDTVLIAQAGQGNLRAVRQIIWDRRTEVLQALETAAAKGHLSTVQYLATFDRQGESHAVDKAALAGHTHIVAWLLDHYQQSMHLTFNTDTLRTVAAKGDVTTLQLLLQCLPSQQREHYRQMALETARQTNQWPLIVALSQRSVST